MDTNVFLQDPAPLAAGQVQAGVPAEAQAVAFVAGVAVEQTWRPGANTSLEASYSPELTRYSRFKSENHFDNRLAIAGSHVIDLWRLEVRASALFTDGTETSPVFNRLGGAPCIGAEPVRARRTQDIYRASGTLCRTLPHGFIRGTGAFYRQDFHTIERSLYGYANYADRGEATAGVEGGWKTGRSIWLVGGFRAGRQEQANVLGVRLNAANSLVRWLVGAEGSVGRTLKFSVLAGPDERRYGADVAAGFDRDRTSTYAESSVTWTPSAADTVTFTGKHYAWLSSGGRSVYDDFVGELGWKHRLAATWSGAASFNHHTGNSRRYNPSSPRDESIEGARVALSHTVDAWSIDASWQHEWSVTSVPNTPGRTYHRDIVSLGASRAW